MIPRASGASSSGSGASKPMGGAYEMARSSENMLGGVTTRPLVTHPSTFNLGGAHDHEPTVRHPYTRELLGDISHQHPGRATRRHGIQLQSVPDRRRGADQVLIEVESHVNQY